MTALQERNYIYGERNCEEADLMNDECLSGNNCTHAFCPEHEDFSVWTPIDNRLLMTREQYYEHLEWRGEAEAEIGSEYFIDTRNASDAMFVARQYVRDREERIWGMSADAIEDYYSHGRK